MPTENRSSNTGVPFQREDRYIVIKVSDLANVPVAVAKPFAEQLTAIQRRFPKRECLVIESDWPEFEPTWAAIEARVTGKPAEQHQGEPVAWMTESGSFTFDSVMAAQRGNYRPLYTRPGAGDVERLVAANTEFSRRHLAQLNQIQRLRAQLDEALTMAELVRDAAPGMQRQRLSALLSHLFRASASAEPEAKP